MIILRIQKPIRSQTDQNKLIRSKENQLTTNRTTTTTCTFTTRTQQYQSNCLQTMDDFTSLFKNLSIPFMTDDSVQNNVSTIISDVPQNEDHHMSYFFQFYNKLISNTDSRFFAPVPEEKIPLNRRAYEHPQWHNWKTIWSTPPIVLQPQIIWDPVIEPSFQSALFQLRLTSEYIAAMHKEIIFRQGTTLTFSGYEHSTVRFIVEWCQQVSYSQHDAYLKIVGIDSTGRYFSYSDPDFPSFIIIVPICIVQVPSPTPAIYLKNPSLISTRSLKEKKENCNVCWLCGHVGLGLFNITSSFL